MAISISREIGHFKVTATVMTAFTAGTVDFLPNDDGFPPIYGQVSFRAYFYEAPQPSRALMAGAL
jgi:hypothetical protein